MGELFAIDGEIIGLNHEVCRADVIFRVAHLRYTVCYCKICEMHGLKCCEILCVVDDGLASFLLTFVQDVANTYCGSLELP